MATVITVMDPVTRIEGHMKVEVTINQVNNVTQVTDAKCTGTMFRGFETILKEGTRGTLCTSRKESAVSAPYHTGWRPPWRPKPPQG